MILGRAESGDRRNFSRNCSEPVGKNTGETLVSGDFCRVLKLQISGDDQCSRLRRMEMGIDTHKATIPPVLPVTPLVAHPVVVVFESPLNVILPESTLVENFRWH